jgi:hypothetical protein
VLVVTAPGARRVSAPPVAYPCAAASVDFAQ